MPSILPRQYGCGYGYYYNNGNCVSYGNWYYWGRWVLAAVVVVLFLIFLVACLCISRRRQRRGVRPLYGTGWMGNMGGNKWNNGQQPQNYQMYNYGQPGYNNPPPAYGQQQPQYTGSSFNPNDGYYAGGGQYSGVQPPAGTYQREEQYPPPPAPPPGKTA